MKNSLTSFFGIAGAVAMAVSQVVGLSPCVHTGCLVVSAVCVALLGWNAADKRPRPPLPCGFILACAIGVLAFTCSGCRLGGFVLNVKSAQFGTLGLAFDSGSIGNRAVSHTNALHQLPPP